MLYQNVNIQNIHDVVHGKRAQTDFSRDLLNKWAETLILAGKEREARVSEILALEEESEEEFDELMSHKRYISLAKQSLNKIVRRLKNDNIIIPI